IKAELLGEGGIEERGGTRLDTQSCVRLGAALGSIENGKKVGIAFDGSKSAHVMQLAVTAGLVGAGGAVWDFGECFEAQLNFLVNFCGLDAGLFVSGRNGKRIAVCGEDGLSITRKFERELESSVAKGEFRETNENEIKEISDMSSVRQLYVQELAKQAPEGLAGISVNLKCENESIKNLLCGCISRLGADEGEELVFEISPSGTRLGAELGGVKYEHEKLLAVCCMHEMKNGRDVAVPYDAPKFIDSFEESFGKRVLRYLATPADSSDATARRLASKQFFSSDALFLAVRLLAIMKESGRNLAELIYELPEKYILRKTVSIGFPPSYLSTLVGVEGGQRKNDFEGVRLVRSSGSLLIIPERSGENVRILAEADTMEAANELCADVEDIFNTATERQ
ncbi:MAG: hypothetical protein IJ264_00740, partial [Clostridia bacterium]|nr:hypothetical protein [Clostridia bacterium]